MEDRHARPAGAPEERFDAGFRDGISLPLARLYTRAHNAKSRLERHSSALYLLEATVKLAATAQLACYLGVERRNPRIDARLAHLALPSFGHWTEFLRMVADHLARAEPHPFPELSGVAASLREERDDLPATAELLRALTQEVPTVPPFRGDRVRPLDLIDRLPTYRNLVLGHGALRPEAFYTALGDRLLAAAVELLERVPLLGRARLVWVGEVKEVAGGGRRAELWDLTGPEAIRAGEDEAAGRSLRPGRLCLRSGDAFLSLHPLLTCEPAPPEAAVLFLNRSRGGGRIEYLDYVTGETACRADLLVAHRDLLSALLGGPLSDGAWSRLQERSLSDAPDPPDEPAASTKRFGDFELLGRLGEGGMGTVHLARQRSLARLVALKVLPPALARDEVASARFLREIRALARADHPNVVHILQSGRTDGSNWFAMEYVEGSDLSEVGRSLADVPSRSSLLADDLARAVSTGSGRRRREASPGVEHDAVPRPRPTDLGSGRSWFERVAELFRDAANGLQHLHDRGVLHRDLKPANLMVTVDGRAVVMDLGLARLTGETSVTSPAQVLGTVPYAAPEQLQHALLETDARADVYGLGATLYELVTGLPPYRGRDTRELIARILREPPPAPRRVDGAIPRALDAIVQKAMDRNPARRYVSAAALAADLERFRKGEPVGARPPGAALRAGRWLVRHRLAAVSAGALILVLAAGMALGRLHLAEQARERTQRMLGGVSLTLASHVGQTPYRLFAEHARRWLWLLGSPDFVFQMAFYAYLRSGGKAALATLAPHDDLVRGNALLLELRALALLDADRKEELAQTEAALRAVGSRNPTVAEDCFRAFRLIGRARRLGWREGELDDVEEVLRRAVRDDPAHRLARALEGWLRFEQRRFDEALAAFERIPPAATPGESAAAAAWRAVCATLVPGDATHRGRMLVWAEEAWRFEPALFDWMFSSVSQGGSAAEACAFYLDASDRWGEAERAWSSMTLRWAGNLAEHAFQDPGRMERLALRAESLWRPRLAADDAEGYDQVVRGWVWTQLPGVEELKDEAKRSSLEERATRTLEWADRGLARTRRLEYDLHVARALAIGLLAHVANDPAERERRREEAVKLRSRLLSEEMLALERSRLRNAGENKGLEAVRETCERDLQVLLNP